jgi:hypothetical protein
MSSRVGLTEQGERTTAMLQHDDYAGQLEALAGLLWPKTKLRQEPRQFSDQGGLPTKTQSGLKWGQHALKNPDSKGH